MELIVSNDTQEQIPSPTLEVPYCFTEDGHLCHRDTQEPFTFRFQHGEAGENDLQREDQALCLLITQHVHRLLEEQFCLHRVYLPSDPNEGRLGQGFVYISSGALESPNTLVVLIQDWGTVRCGLWNWRLAAREGLEKGSQIPYVRRALEESCSILLMNLNEGGEGGARWVETAQEHVHYVWDHLISRSAAGRVVVVAHGYGGLAFVELLCQRPQEVLAKVWAAAFLDSSHNQWHQRLDPAGHEWLRTRSKRWVLSSKPLNQAVGSLKAGCPQVSAGTQSHDAAPSVCMASVFQFFNKTLCPKQRPTFSIVTRSRSQGQVRLVRGKGHIRPIKSHQ